jgi:hypothetical protein
MIDIKKLEDIDDISAYDTFKLFMEESDKNENIYKHINYLFELLGNKRSYVKVRAALLICRNAKWDKDNYINIKNIDLLLNLLYDEKPTVVRQVLKGLNDLIIYKKKLIPIIKIKVLMIEYNSYKDTMSNLIKKDIDNLCDNMERIK